MTEKRSASGRRKKGLLFGLLTTGLIIAVISVCAAPYLLSQSASAAIIRVPARADNQILRDSLEKYFGEEFAGRTMTVFTSLGRKPAERFGAYEIPEGATPLQAARILSRGEQTEMRLTINGVRQLLPFADRIAAKFAFSGDDLRNMLLEPAVLSPYGLTPAQASALFLNDTYYFYWTDSPRRVIEKLGENYNKVWNAERRAKADALGLTPAEIMTIASIVDEETNQLDEKGRVGRLYINRLKRHMKLQADPTVRFALGDFTIKRVTGKHLSAPGPYNTYRIEGLPPGPIRTTSVETIDAILNSSPSEDIYMCAKEDFSGYHNFASTYEEHLANARRYQKALDERGIK